VKAVNEALKTARLEKGYTQEQMAEFLGYKSKSGYCMIERGTNQPPLRIALKISELLGKPINVLFHGIDVHDSRTSDETA
jgi:putative transcriptional regulator